MGSGSNSRTEAIFCVCHGQQKMAEVGNEGLAVVSRHHGTYHTGSLSARDLLVQLSGTVEGSAIVKYVQDVVAGA